MANPTTVEGLLTAVQNHSQPHRASLSRPPPPRTTGGAHIDFATIPGPLPRYNRNRETSAQYSVYGAFPHPKPVPWLNKLCHEPEGDVGTCCLGWWLPCALYGNTQWRLKQMAQGDDPLDMSGLRRNNGPCWMHQMLCFFFRCEWCVVMLQHSRVRATYNIDGTAGGDCVQSYYCPCCTLMQDEREVVAREQRILRQQNGTGEVTEQPGFEPQMRYSTSNLLEEIPEIFREHQGGSYPSSTQGLISGHGSARESRRHSVEGRGASDREQGHEMDDLAPFSLGQSDADVSDPEAEHRPGRSRRSSTNSGKLMVRDTSPLGSALNPKTVSRSVSVDHHLQKPKQQAGIPQRSVTSPTRRRSLKDTNPPPANRGMNYRLKSITTDERPDFLIETIREGSESSNVTPTINSRAAVKSLAMESLRSVASKTNTYPGHKQNKSSSDSQDDVRIDEAYTTFYNDEGKLVRRRISECVRPRASTPETPDIYQLHHANNSDAENTAALKYKLTQDAARERHGRKEKRGIMIKLKTPAADISPAKAHYPDAIADGLILLAAPTVAQVLSSPNWLDMRTASPSTAVTSGAEQTGGSDILSLPAGVNDADELAMYLDAAVKDSGLQLKNQNSVDLSAMPDAAMPQGKAQAPLRLGFNSEDSGSVPSLTLEPERGAHRGEMPADIKEEAPIHISAIKQPVVGEDEITTGFDSIDRFPTFITTSDGPATPPNESDLETPLDIQLEDGRRMDDVVKEFGDLTPRHRKSVSDWFKDIGRSNSNKSDQKYDVSVCAKDVPPVPVLPGYLKEQGYSLGPLRSLDPLGFRGVLGCGKTKGKGKGKFETLGPAQRVGTVGKEGRTVSAPVVGGRLAGAGKEVLGETTNGVMVAETILETRDELKEPLRETTNNATVAEAILETQDKLQVLQEEFQLMAEEVVYELANQSPTPTPAASGEMGCVEWLPPVDRESSEIATSAKEMDDGTPMKLGHRSFPLIPPTSSLSKATATSFLVSSGAVDVDHGRHGADMGHANAYEKQTLMTAIKEVAATAVYGTNSPTTFSLSLETLDLPMDLETPSQLPRGFLEHMPGEYPISPLPETPAALEEVVVGELSPVKYFGYGQTRSSSLRVEPSETLSSHSKDGGSGSGSGNSDESARSGHVHENQEVEAADDFESASAAEAMNVTAAARVVSAARVAAHASNLDGVKEDGAKLADVFEHPFFSGTTAVVDFAFGRPKMGRGVVGSGDADEGSWGSEETIRPERVVVNPLVEDAEIAVVERNPLSGQDETPPTHSLTPIMETSRDVSNNTVVRDDDTVLTPPPDHPVAAERIDDALAAITTQSRAGSLHSALTKPIIESDSLRSVCDAVNRGEISYASDSDGMEIVGGVKGRKEGDVVGRSGTVVKRSMAKEAPLRGITPGNSRLQAALKGEVGGTAKVLIGDDREGDGDRVVVKGESGGGMDGALMGLKAKGLGRVHSPTEVRLREMLGKIGPGKGKEVKGKGDGKGDGKAEGKGDGKGDGEKPKKKRSQNSPQRRKVRAERRRREREGEAGGVAGAGAGAVGK